ncbi:hypothetical protein JTE90_016545 [Oedothorax gibbosus]|uniref:C2H2-type domain-containing protein n=1 Tax=Oedothorax gibbosus TaxID=931172 RepID=A0AAV6TIU0_9ARAC|nr:hypothetical protein JTE90_016545 [Oedothorax gibbosus]
MAQTSSTIEMKNSSSDDSSSSSSDTIEKMNSSSDELYAISSSSDTRYTCVKCQKAFKKRRCLNRHIRRHRNYQPLVPTQPYVKDDEGFPINDWLERFMKNSSNISECFYHVSINLF